MQKVYRRNSGYSSGSGSEQNDFLSQPQQQQIFQTSQGNWQIEQEIVKSLLSEQQGMQLEEKVEEQTVITIDQEITDPDALQVELLNSVHLNVLPRQKAIQVQEYSQILPVVLQIQSLKSQLKKQRANIDLMCVVDVSGSMNGEKIKLVQNSLRYIQKILKPTDRLALVTFGTQAGINLQWTRNIAENKKKIKKAIKDIKIRDSTNIASGVALGLRMIRDRKFKNPVTSMFVLSDGVDDDRGADLRCQQALHQYNIQDTLTINTFGYGSDHDAKVMNNIANLKGGQFVYIDQIQRVSEHFILAMSGMLSVKAKNVILTVKQLNNEFKLSKIFGDDFLWNKISETEFQLTLNYLVDEDKKEFALEIEIPGFKQQELVLENIMQIDLQGVFIGLNTAFKKSSNLELEFSKTEVQYQPVELVEVNYLRAKAGDRIGQAKELANSKKYDQSIQLLNQMIDEIENSLFKDSKQLVVVLKDLNDIKQVCKPQTYERDGEAMMLHKQKNHIQRQRSINNSEEWCEDEEEQMNQFKNGNLNLSQSYSGGSCKSIGNVKNVVMKLDSQSDGSYSARNIDPNEDEDELEIKQSPKILKIRGSRRASPVIRKQRDSRGSSVE
ncbi:unnamed protein product (macronuclear) [Paramecium tetraurelia]|uniref:VWFA domain-containing protein n=1 Tax=Paramecium tetraurelia TaxID=5888 RepID=A0EFJ5_PARTE|nr:uncharacterized protein GSPATT00026409001 [Paramecium tetraurelia]CAK94086.1 unnamed protein product [Paramecium tetraurelia]|eukprot:XP_001461459.1 hypothetical protein (macronuclear) [Paramecium tetraurelia strain d4-2]